MARQKGTLSLASNIEPGMNAPLDARETVNLLADLTTAASFPYYYEGMQVYCKENKKTYKLIGDDTTDSENWQEIGSGGSGSDPELTAAITASISVGGIEAGQTFPVGTKLEALWKKLISPALFPTLTNPSATLSATGAKLLEKGATLATTFTCVFDRGSITPAYGTSGYRSGAATDYALNSGTPQSGNTWNETVTEAQLTYRASVDYAAGEQPKDSTGEDYDSPLPAGSINSNTITYEFVDAIWANTSSIATVAKLGLVSKSAKVKEFNFPAQTIANPEIFDVPGSWTVTAVEVLNTLSNQWEDCSSEFTVTTTSHDNAAGVATSYNRYTDNRGYAAGSRKVRVKWS